MGYFFGARHPLPPSRLAMLWLMGGSIFSMTVFLTVGALSEKKGIKSFYYQAGLMERTKGFLLFSLMLLPAYLVPLTWLFVAVEVFTALQRLAEAHTLFARLHRGQGAPASAGEATGVTTGLGVRGRRDAGGG